MRTAITAAAIAILIVSASAPAIGAGAVASSTAYKVPEDPDIRVGVYLASSAQGESDHVSGAITAARGSLEGAVPTAEVVVGPEGVVEVPDDRDGSARETWEWFCSAVDRDSMDAVILVLPLDYADEWKYGGYGGNGCAVALGAELMHDDGYQTLFVHETGHALGLGHGHASVAGTTVMDSDAVHDPTLEWSGHSEAKLNDWYAPS